MLNFGGVSLSFSKGRLEFYEKTSVCQDVLKEQTSSWNLQLKILEDNQICHSLPQRIGDRWSNLTSAHRIFELPDIHKKAFLNKTKSCNISLGLGLQTSYCQSIWCLNIPSPKPTVRPWKWARHQIESSCSNDPFSGTFPVSFREVGPWVQPKIYTAVIGGLLTNSYRCLTKIIIDTFSIPRFTKVRFLAKKSNQPFQAEDQPMEFGA